MQEYEKAGYLTSGFRFFHIKDREQREFSYHYHDFHKILILLGGDVTYCVEGRSYALLPRDIVLIHAGEVHRPVIHSGCVYDRMILYVSPGSRKTIWACVCAERARSRRMSCASRHPAPHAWRAPYARSKTPSQTTIMPAGCTVSFSFWNL